MKNGLLCVYKEAGWTSSDVVSKLRGIIGQKRIGHTGTLDPDAVGVLVICLGTATRLTEMLTDHEKEYIAVCQLGVATDTQDIGGRVLEKKDASNVTKEDIIKAVQSFKGEYEQTPPMYSALKVGGKKLYELAREGKTVERKARTVHIDAITVLDLSLLSSDALFTMEVKCSRGTYIRTLCNDIGLSLGTGACMAALTRTAVGSFRIEEAKTIAQIQALADAGELDPCILPTDAVYKNRDKIIVKNDALKSVRNGNALTFDLLVSEAPDTEQDVIDNEASYTEGTLVRVYDETGEFYGIWKYSERKKRFECDLYLYAAK